MAAELRHEMLIYLIVAPSENDQRFEGLFELSKFGRCFLSSFGRENIRDSCSISRSLDTLVVRRGRACSLTER